MEDKKNKIKIDRNITFSELLKKYPESAEVLLESGMHCFGCPMSQMESLEQGCSAHGIDVKEMIKKIEEKIK